MQIVLRKKVDSLGEAGTVVQVAPGYARNYLFPQNWPFRLLRPTCAK